jgi:hypothetical protein
MNAGMFALITSASSNVVVEGYMQAPVLNGLGMTQERAV